MADYKVCGCGQTVCTSNALGRKAHERGKWHQAWLFRTFQDSKHGKR